MIWNWKNTVTSENQDAAALQETLRRPRSRTYTEAEVVAREAAAAAEVERLRKALRQIRDLGLGPDRGSAQWQIGAANEIARAALAGEGNGND